jgi:hypothetical protein
MSSAVPTTGRRWAVPSYCRRPPPASSKLRRRMGMRRCSSTVSWRQMSTQFACGSRSAFTILATVPEASNILTRGWSAFTSCTGSCDSPTLRQTLRLLTFRIAVGLRNFTSFESLPERVNAGDTQVLQQAAMLGACVHRPVRRVLRTLQAPVAASISRGSNPRRTPTSPAFRMAKKCAAYGRSRWFACRRGAIRRWCAPWPNTLLRLAGSRWSTRSQSAGSRRRPNISIIAGLYRATRSPDEKGDDQDGYDKGLVRAEL